MWLRWWEVELPGELARLGGAGSEAGPRRAGLSNSSAGPL